MRKKIHVNDQPLLLDIAKFENDINFFRMCLKILKNYIKNSNQILGKQPDVCEITFSEITEMRNGKITKAVVK